MRCRIALSALRGMTVTLAEKLLGMLPGREQEFFETPEHQLRMLLGRTAIVTDKVRREALAEADREMAFIAEASVRALYYSDAAYPRRLAECPDAPVMLYGIGDCDLNAAHTLAVVGTRRATGYGTEAVGRIVRDLAAGMAEPPVIVSGLAYGIDIAAHRAALAASAPTVAVLAHGLNTIYPAAHRSDAVGIVRHGGMLLTEYRSGEATHRGNFLARNRIVAGMSDCTLVAESAAKGGAIVTARLARDYDREVAALPGRATDPYSVGCNALIAGDVARLATSAADIAAINGWQLRSDEPEQTQLALVLSPEEQAVIDLLTDRGDLRQSELMIALDISSVKLMTLLVDMEFRGLVARVPGGRYRLA